MKIILISHGSYSQGLLESVQMLAGEQEDIVAYGLYPEKTVDSLVDDLKKEINSTDSNEELLCFTDLFCGSPFNAVVKLMEHNYLYHVAGISLALLLEAILARGAGSTAQQICEQVVAAAAESVKDVGQYLRNSDIDN